MIEEMIPTYTWDGEYWILYTLDEFKDSISRLRFCDGKVENIIFSVSNYDGHQRTLNKLFKKYNWIDKVIILENGDNLIGVYQNKMK